MTVNNDYRYKKFTTKLLLRDMRFHKSAPKAGEPFPEFKLVTTDGNTISKQDFVDRKPLLLIFGSLTCPMTASAIPTLKQLHRQFGDRIEFVMLNVREAHPGERIPQPETFAQKLTNAKALKHHFDMAWTVATDDIDGKLHHSLDTKPNAAFLMDEEGNIIFRSIWARDEQSLEAALTNVVSGNAQLKKQSTKMLMPVARAMGHLAETMDRAGTKAWREMWIAGFPIALAGRIAMLLKPLPRDWRGISSVTIITAAMLTAAVLVWTWF